MISYFKFGPILSFPAGKIAVFHSQGGATSHHISLYKAALNLLWIWLTDSLKPANTTYLFIYLFTIMSQKLEMRQHDTRRAIYTPSHEITLSKMIHPERGNSGVQ